MNKYFEPNPWIKDWFLQKAQETENICYVYDTR